ncbi:MAG: transposase [Betaproteobacteria bacterium]|nr:transposase [Betaproteobacteria bacterium]
MPRRPRLNLTGLPLHIIQRGNNRSACFFADEDYRFYLHSLRLLSAKHRCAVHAYVLMTNHVHLLLTPADPTGASRLMQAMGRHYVPYVNQLYKRTGTLFEGRFKASVINAEEYLLKCYCYIELNPVRARIVDNPADYLWSSYRYHSIGACNDIVQDHALFAALDSDETRRRNAYTALIRTELDLQTLGSIRTATNRGQALGDARFREMIGSAMCRVGEPESGGGLDREGRGINVEQIDLGF